MHGVPAQPFPVENPKDPLCKWTENMQQFVHLLGFNAVSYFKCRHFQPVQIEAG